MVQFNLLPDVKQEYIKTRRTKRLMILVSIGASGLAVFILVLLLVSVDVVQRQSLNSANSNIARYSNQIKSVKDLDKILTVQNQLNTLPGLHDQKVVTSRLFGFISQLTPNSASISKLTVDFTANTVVVTGAAPSLDAVNAFTDTLKNTTYTAGGSGANAHAFSKVVLTSFGRDNKGATYTINCDFDPVIFNSAQEVKLVVPNGTTGAQAQLFQQGGAQ